MLLDRVPETEPELVDCKVVEAATVLEDSVVLREGPTVPGVELEMRACELAVVTADEGNDCEDAEPPTDDDAAVT